MDIRIWNLLNIVSKVFRGSKSKVLSDFSEKYKQIALNIKNKQKIYDFIKNKLKLENNEL